MLKDNYEWVSWGWGSTESMRFIDVGPEPIRPRVSARHCLQLELRAISNGHEYVSTTIITNYECQLLPIIILNESMPDIVGPTSSPKNYLLLFRAIWIQKPDRRICWTNLDRHCDQSYKDYLLIGFIFTPQADSKVLASIMRPCAGAAVRPWRYTSPSSTARPMAYRNRKSRRQQLRRYFRFCTLVSVLHCFIVIFFFFLKLSGCGLQHWDICQVCNYVRERA